jgi:hypothetical protein
MSGEPTAELIRDELAAERDTRRSFEQRALSLFASAGVIGGLLGIASRGQDLPTVSRVALVFAIAALGAGALYGLAVANPTVIEEVLDPDELRDGIDDEDWKQEAVEHLRRASRARIVVMENAHAENERKGKLLRRGMWCAFAAIVFLLVGVVWAAVEPLIS